MPSHDVETYYAAGRWHCRVEGEADAFSSGDSKTEQVARGAAEARRRRCEHIVKNAYGLIDQRVSYCEQTPASTSPG